jgi:hypothetical protein
MRQQLEENRGRGEKNKEGRKQCGEKVEWKQTLKPKFLQIWEL